MFPKFVVHGIQSFGLKILHNSHHHRTAQMLMNTKCILLQRQYQNVKNVCNNNHIRSLTTEANKKQTVGEVVKQLIHVFRKAGIYEAESSAEYIVSHACGHKTLHQLDCHQPVAPSIHEHIDEMVSLRLSHMPVQYVLGEWDFRDLTLAMRPPVFIPRPETEELVGLILACPELQNAGRFLEIGCGSGAISLALLHSLPQWHGVAIDQSEAACDLTLHNSRLVGVADRLQVIHGHFTHEEPSFREERHFDFVVSNPPYIPSENMKDLQVEITRYEDFGALDGGQDGMDVVKVIMQRVTQLLTPNGYLWLEVDPSHPALIEKYVRDNVHLGLHYVATHQDFLQRDRFSQLRLRSHIDKPS